MDSLTQVVLGASVQGAILGKYQGRRAYIYGAMLGTLPDLDVLLSYPDPISSMTYHRGFSHSLFVLTAVGIGGAWLISKFYQWRGQPLPYSTRRLAVAMTLALTTHPLLDSLTVYGTQLFWPFTPPPTSIASMFIIDPIYTIPLLIAMIAGLIKGKRLAYVQGVSDGQATHQLKHPSKQWFANCQRFTLYMLLISSSYLLLSIGLKYIAQNKAEQTLASANIDIARIKTMPMLPSTIMWRSLAQTPTGQIYEVRGSLLDKRLPEYRQLNQYQQSNALKSQVPTASQPHTERLTWFTDAWTAYRQQPMANNKQGLVIEDLRMIVGDEPLFSFVVATADSNANHSSEGSYKQANWQAITPDYSRLHKIELEQDKVTETGKPVPDARLEMVKNGFRRMLNENEGIEGCEVP